MSAVPQSKGAMGRIRSIDRTKRRHVLAGSCGSTSGRAGCWVIQATSPSSPTTSAMRQAFSGEVDGEGVEELRRQLWALHD